MFVLAVGDWYSTCLVSARLSKTALPWISQHLRLVLRTGPSRTSSIVAFAALTSGSFLVVGWNFTFAASFQCLQECSDLRPFPARFGQDLPLRFLTPALLLPEVKIQVGKRVITDEIGQHVRIEGVEFP